MTRVEDDQLIEETKALYDQLPRRIRNTHIAEATGLHQVWIGNFEKGKMVQPPIDKVKRLHAFLRTHVVLTPSPRVAAPAFAGKVVMRGAVGAEALRRMMEPPIDEIAAAEPGIHGYGDGLYLRVKPTGRRSWILRVQHMGKREDIGLGSYPLVTLAKAQEKALELRRVAKDGGDARQARDDGSVKRAAKPKPMMARIAYRVSEVAELLSVSRRTVERMIDDGSLRSSKVGRTILIPAAQLHAVVEGAGTA